VEPGYLERTSVLDIVGAASSRDRLNSRLEAAPTGVFFSYLSLPDMRIIFFHYSSTPILHYANVKKIRKSEVKQESQMKNKVAVVILAAGMGTRMKSNKAKVLHEIADRPMIVYVAEAARKVAGDDVIVVIGNQAQTVRRCLSGCGELIFAHQDNQLGTAHAVLCALPHIPDHCEEVVILCGDVPLIQPETITGLVESHRRDARDISLLAVELDNPYGYGRVLLDDNRQVSGIIEEADATAEQKANKLINAGIYCVKKGFLLEALPQIRSDNAQGELYLTDIMAIGYRGKKKMGVRIADDDQQILGVNTGRDLELVGAIMKKQMRNMP
jgi:UDP-N-acetylglucosamine diphosphorylase/glucosamine-1-phosphate N-acetyltransferase